MKITEGAKVLVNRPGYQKVQGTVSNVIDLDTESIFIVDIGDGKIKASIEDLVPIQEETKPEQKDEITITREEFSEFAVNVVIEESAGNLRLGLEYATLLAILECKLFGNPNND